MSWANICPPLIVILYIINREQITKCRQYIPHVLLQYSLMDRLSELINALVTGNRTLPTPGKHRGLDKMGPENPLLKGFTTVLPRAASLFEMFAYFCELLDYFEHVGLAIMFPRGGDFQ